MSDIYNDFSKDIDFSNEERERRWREVRWRMDHAGLDALLVWGNESKWQAGLANNRYLSGRVAPGCVLFPLVGDPIIWSGFPHDVTPYGALAGGWIGDTRAGQQTTQDIINTLKDRKFEGASIGVVGFGSTRPRVITETVPYQQFSAIKNALNNAQFINADWLVEQARMIKSDEEIAVLRRAGALAREIANALYESAKVGAHEYEVYAAMLNASLSRGGEEEMNWMSSGAVPPPHGKRPPSSPRVLEKGDLIVSEYHSRYKGYLAGAEISVSLGKPRKEYQEIHEVCVASQRAGIAAMQPGKPFADAVWAFRQPIIDAGFNSVECGLHGHGLASPEFPSTMYGGKGGAWDEHAYARIPSINFQENMVFATASDVYNPDWDDSTGLMLGRTVIITADGPEEITGIPLVDELKVV